MNLKLTFFMFTSISSNNPLNLELYSFILFIFITKLASCPSVVVYETKT